VSEAAKQPPVDAAVLAGGPPGGMVAESAGVSHRMLVPVQGEPMIVHVLRRLRRAQRLERILVGTPPEVRQHIPEGLVDAFTDPGDSFVANLTGMAREAGPQRGLLACTGDIALITPEAVDDFVARSLECGCELGYGAVPMEDNDRMFPGGKRTAVRLREGRFTGGNIVYLAPGLVESHAPLIQRLYEDRKSPVRLARVLGLGFVLRLLVGRLSTRALERRASQILQAQVRVIVSHYPEVGFDVDKMEDLETLRLYLAAHHVWE